MFGTVLTVVMTFMHVYVFWRAASVPWIREHISRIILIGVGLILWTLFVSSRIIGHSGTGDAAAILEFLGMNWMAGLFLMFVALLAVELMTVFGFFMPRLAPRLRGWSLLLGVALSLIALIQGLRSPVVEAYDIHLAGLPQAMDGTVLVILSDMHLGSQLGERWLTERIAQTMALRPDLVAILGDISEGHGPPDDQLLAAFGQLSAPLGVWAVLGNHESYRGGETSVLLKAGFSLLRNRWAEVQPGLILAGVDDLTSYRTHGQSGDPLAQALAGRPTSGATILLSHTPWEAEKAAGAGVGLMLCGHTHGGQIWPFDYLVRTRYPLLEGRYEANGMTTIVCRGTGTWGPRMRLWSPGEILQVTLRGSNEMNTPEPLPGED